MTDGQIMEMIYRIISYADYDLYTEWQIEPPNESLEKELISIVREYI